MKKYSTLFTLISIFILAPILGFCQAQGGSLSSLLTTYYSIKNALVAGDAVGANKAATDFVATANAIDAKTLTAPEQKAYTTVKAKLLADAGVISGTKDLVKQRASFHPFSDNMIILIKAAKTTTPVYVDYCPMKKAFWLSSEKEIKNPYYGSTMLSCGQVTDTIR